MLPAERHDRIIRHVERHRRASVEELAASLAISAATVRRDLERLERAGLLGRVHGGAVPSDAPALRPAATASDDRLARAIVDSLSPGDAAILEGQAVMPLVARMLAAEPIRMIVISNHLDIARTLAARPGIEVILLGGKVHPSGYTLPRPVGAGDLKFVVANKAFVEIEGMHPVAGATAAGSDDARFKRELLQHAMQKFVVAPQGRYGLAFAHRIARAAEVDAWITTAVEPADRSAVDALGCAVIESAA